MMIFGFTDMKSNLKYRSLGEIENISKKAARGIGLSWGISEVFCNKYTYIGHALWHIFFPLGFIQVIHKMDRILYKSYTKKNLSRTLLKI